MARMLIAKLRFLFPLKLFAQYSDKKNWEYKPKNLDDAISLLDLLLQDSTKQQIYEITEDAFINSSHLSISMWVRDNWGLCNGKQLAKYFNNLGIYHPEYMSDIILRSYQRYLQKKDRELDKQIQFYRDYLETTLKH